MESKLPPLHTTYEPVDNELVDRVELTFPKCKHDLYLVSTTEARCRKCTVSYSGPGIIKLVKEMQS